jgi:hypothetical protein
MEPPELYKENLLKLVQDVDFIKKQQILHHPRSDKLAIIIDPRFDDIMEAVIRNFMYFMNPHGWNLLIMSHSKYQSTIQEKFPNCKVCLLDEDIVHYDENHIPNISIDSYNHILLDKTFWTSLPEHAENICIFQKDCIMFKMFQDYHYLNFDFSGANYYNEKHLSMYYGGINGGFSLRKKTAMIQCLEIDMTKLNNYRIEQYTSHVQRLLAYSRETNPQVLEAWNEKMENYKKIVEEPIHEDVFFTIACEMLYKLVMDKVHRTFLSIETDLNLDTCVFHGWQHNYHSLDAATHLLHNSSLFGKYINNIAD